MSESTFTIRVDSHLKEAFVQAASMNDRTGAQLVRDYMREYVQSARDKGDYEEWFKAKVEAGLRDIEEGRVISHEEIKVRSLARRERLLAKSKEHA